MRSSSAHWHAGRQPHRSVCLSMEGSAPLGRRWSWVLVSSLTQNTVCVKVLTGRAVTPNCKAQLRIPSLAKCV